LFVLGDVMSVFNRIFGIAMMYKNYLERDFKQPYEVCSNCTHIMNCRDKIIVPISNPVMRLYVWTCIVLKETSLSCVRWSPQDITYYLWSKIFAKQKKDYGG
jgi:hypothetical protein